MADIVNTNDPKVADTQERSLRAFIQGTIATLVVSVLPIIIRSVQVGIDKVDWSTLYVSAGTAATMVVLTAIMGWFVPASNVR